MVPDRPVDDRADDQRDERLGQHRAAGVTIMTIDRAAVRAGPAAQPQQRVDALGSARPSAPAAGGCLGECGHVDPRYDVDRQRSTEFRRARRREFRLEPRGDSVVLAAHAQQDVVPRRDRAARARACSSLGLGRARGSRRRPRFGRPSAGIGGWSHAARARAARCERHGAASVAGRRRTAAWSKTSSPSRQRAGVRVGHRPGRPPPGDSGGAAPGRLGAPGDTGRIGRSLSRSAAVSSSGGDGARAQVEAHSALRSASPPTQCAMMIH